MRLASCRLVSGNEHVIPLAKNLTRWPCFVTCEFPNAEDIKVEGAVVQMQVVLPRTKKWQRTLKSILDFVDGVQNATQDVKDDVNCLKDYLVSGGKSCLGTQRMIYHKRDGFPRLPTPKDCTFRRIGASSSSASVRHVGYFTIPDKPYFSSNAANMFYGMDRRLEFSESYFRGVPFALYRGHPQFMAYLDVESRILLGLEEEIESVNLKSQHDCVPEVIQKYLRAEVKFRTEGRHLCINCSLKLAAKCHQDVLTIPDLKDTLYRHGCSWDIEPPWKREEGVKILKGIFSHTQPDQFLPSCKQEDKIFNSLVDETRQGRSRATLWERASDMHEACNLRTDVIR